MDDLDRRLARIEALLESYIRQSGREFGEIKETLREHSGRIRATEISAARLAVIVGGGGALAGALGSMLSTLLMGSP